MESILRREPSEKAYRPRQYSRVLLREPERCFECNKVFLSLYRLRCCADHEGLEEI